MSLKTLSAGGADKFNVVIEIAAFSAPIKYEIDPETGILAVDRFMPTPMFYPANYGFIPSTLCDDGDPLDVLVLTPHALQPGSLIACRPLGVLEMSDESGGDNKLLAVPTEKICPQYAHLKDLDDVSELTRNQIRHFFEHYKDLEPKKWVKLEAWHGKEAAQKIILDSIALFEKS